jgi:hypothetical protein
MPGKIGRAEAEAKRREATRARHHAAWLPPEYGRRLLKYAEELEGEARALEDAQGVTGGARAACPLASTEKA